MALNIKAAMLVCAACIGGSAWMIHEMDVQENARPSPLVAAGVPVDVALGRPADEWSRPLPAGVSRSALATRFAAPNPIDAQAARNRQAEKALAVAEPEPEPQSPINLPPLAQPTNAADEVRLVAMVAPEVPVGDAASDPRTRPVDAAADDVVAVEDAVAAAGDAELVMKDYRVARGDNLTLIARRQCGSNDPRMIEVIMDLNPQVRERDGQILAGETLRIPGRDAAQELLARAAEEENGPAYASAVRWYTVKRNDSLVQIARRHLHDGTRWREIAELNDSIKPNKIYPGMRLRLPPAVSVSRS